MRTSQGFSLAELLVALGLIALASLSLSATWLYAQHAAVQNHQTEIAAQLLNNIAKEQLTQPKWKNTSSWQAELEQHLPNANLFLKPQKIQLTWLSMSKLEIHCQTNKETEACVAYLL